MKDGVLFGLLAALLLAPVWVPILINFLRRK